MPFDGALQVNVSAYLSHCRSLFDAGCDGLMPLGSTGEAHSLTVEERLSVMTALAESGLPCSKMIVGTSALAYPDTVRLVREADGMGFGGVCVQPPFYYKPVDDEGLFRFYAKVIEDAGSGRLRLYVYDWEPNLRIHHSIAFFRRLFEAFPDNAVGLKDSSGDAKMLCERCRAFPDQRVFVGTDALALTGLRGGAVGVMSSISNIVPGSLVDLFKHSHSDVGERAQDRIDQIKQHVAPMSWFPALKSVLAWMTADEAWENVRPPLRPLTAQENAALQQRLAAIGFRANDCAAE